MFSWRSGGDNMRNIIGKALLFLISASLIASIFAAFGGALAEQENNMEVTVLVVATPHDLSHD